MSPNRSQAATIADDERQLAQMGYAQELARRMNGFSNLAISLSIICILAGGITSFHLGFCSVGGAAIGLGWPLVCGFSLIVAATMAQVASAFPTAGGLYHWAAILGVRGWGWTTAWFNLAGLVTVLAAINVGTYKFLAGAYFPSLESHLPTQLLIVAAITFSQAAFNHLGIRLTSWLTDLSGYWILAIAAILTLSLLATAETWEPARLVTFSNYSGLPATAAVWPPSQSLGWLFALGFLLPAYTITGFDASAHVSEETIGAAINVPRGIVRSVLVSGIAGYIMLAAIVLAIPDMHMAATQGPQVFFWTLREVLPVWAAGLLFGGIGIAQYLCGLATVTSASRMMYAFARDGGLPGSIWLRRVCPLFRTPDVAIWTVALAAYLFTVYTPVYSTITAVCTILLYISYVLPSVLGLVAYGRTWRQMGPWHLGKWYRPLAAVSALGCVGLIVIGMQPPNDKAQWIVGAAAVVLAAGWWFIARHRFAGPPTAAATPYDQLIAPQSTAAPPNASENWLTPATARTPARVFVDRCGPAYRTATQLRLRADHAFALDAVHDEITLARDFAPEFVASRNLFAVQTQATTKREFLLRPDLGRRLSDATREELSRCCPHGPQVQIVLGDGLSAAAIRQVPPLLPLLEREFERRDWKLGQTFLVRYCRVGLMNEIGDLLAPEVLVLLIGERPGLATAESMSAYLAYRPQTGHTDAQRNLISNIHPRGVSVPAAAERIAALIQQMYDQRSSGITIKERLPPPRLC
jgi:ethanolamine ammonia-lyase small subunit/amino acid transporter